jgi:hypothetical protein
VPGIHPGRALIAAALLAVAWSVALARPAGAQNPYVFETPIKKLALVIGNADYASQQKLAGALLDAGRVAGALRNLGFDVSEHENLVTRKDFSDALVPFLRKIDPGSLVVFYYSGHGLSYGGENYLLPLQFAVPVPAAKVADTFVAMTELRDRLKDGQPTMLMMVFDACRSLSNIIDTTGAPGKMQTKGLAMPNAGDALIWFSSELGYESYMPDPAQSSFYTDALVKRLPNQDEEIDQVRKWIVLDVRNATGQKQSPWSNESSAAEVWFNPSGKTLQALKQIWQTTLDSKDPGAISDFVQRYGTSLYAEAARKWLRDNPNAPPATSPISPQTLETIWENSQPHPVTATGSAAGSRPIDLESLRSDRALAAPRAHIAGPTLTGAIINPHILDGTVPQIVVKSSIEANSAKSSASAKVTLPAGTMLEALPANRGRDPADNNWLEVRNPNGAGNLFIPLDAARDGPKTLDVGKPVLQRTVPPPASGPLAMVDPEFVKQAVADIRRQGNSISWVSIATPPARQPSDNALYVLRAQQAVGLLVQQDVSRQRITIVEGSATGEPNIRLRFFGR